MQFSRREVGELLVSAVPGVSVWRTLARHSSQAVLSKPDSTVAGVRIGLNVPYNFGNPSMSGDDILRNCVRLGISAVELRSQPVEAFLGVPAHLVAAGGGAAKAAELRRWRLSVPMERVTAFRRKYEDAGVRIEIVKFDGIYALADDAIDYCFELARTLGARAISCEISLDDTRRLGRFADRHQMMIGYHGHTATTPQMWETAFGYAQYNGANVDLGHFVAGNNISPVPFISRHHDRITHVHVKDRKLHEGPNVPFGQGDTPIREVLQLIRNNKWNIQATIEFEYPVPPGSDRIAEMAKCIEFCRAALA